MTEDQPHVKSVQFQPDGTLIFDYGMLPADLRSNGLVAQRSLMVPPHPDLIDELDHLETIAKRTLVRCLAVFERGEPMMPSDIEVEDDEVAGPYDNPEER